MKRLLLLFIVLGALLAPAAALAHPLGNFTINQFTRIQPSGDRVYLLYVLDMAEIPTFQARDEVRAQGQDAYAAGLARQISRGLTVTLDGKRAVLRELRHAIAFPQGAGGLQTTRLEVLFATAAQPAGDPISLAFTNTNYDGRIGWREIVLDAVSGASAASASAPASSISDELRAYPKDLLQSPLDVRSATAEITPGEIAEPPPTLLDGSQLSAPVRVASQSDRGFAALIARDKLSAGVVLVSLLVAVFWGMVHALSPGHGKSIVAAYLVGTRGTARQAVYLGGIVTVTHTIGVFALGLVTLALSEFVVPDRLYPWLNLVAALLVVTVGVGVLRRRLLDWLGWRGVAPRQDHSHDHDYHDHHHHDGEDHQEHGDGHDHAHDHGHHHHVPEESMGWRSLLGVGISGGLLPCPSALVVLLAAISLHRVGYGLVLILAFSLGLAGTITGIGLLAISAKRVLRRASFQGRLVRLLPAVSAAVILALGIAMTIRALPKIT